MKSARNVEALAGRYPFFMGNLKMNGALRALFIGAHITDMLILSTGQVEYAAATLARHSEKKLEDNPNLDVGLDNFLRGLQRSRYAEIALEKGWVKSDALLEAAAFPEDYHINVAPWLPEGQPTYIQDDLRTMLGARLDKTVWKKEDKNASAKDVKGKQKKRAVEKKGGKYEFLNDIENGEEINLAGFSGDTWINHHKIIAKLGPGEVISVLPKTTSATVHKFIRAEGEVVRVPPMPLQQAAEMPARRQPGQQDAGMPVAPMPG